MGIRVGLGTDLHPLVEGRPLWLGGVEIPAERGALGHSDGDVVLHALTDALLGAVGGGDVGELFADTDAANRGLASATILREASRRVQQAGARVVNVDVVIELETPQVQPFRDAIRARIAEILETGFDRVFVKAKTAEGLGPVGEGRAIAATVVCLLELD